MIIKKSHISYKEVPHPMVETGVNPVDLDDATMEKRKQRLLEKMKENNYDAVVIYGDREHSANYSYLTGFDPRFEESLIVLHKSGKAYLLLGNEALKMVNYSRLKAEAIRVPYFSLPNQPMEHEQSLIRVFKEAELEVGMSIGVIGWKLFTSAYEDNKAMFDVPSFIIDALRSFAGENGRLVNAADIMIHPEYGIKTCMNANEIAHYEFGATLSSICMMRMLNAIELGKTEMELGELLSMYGQPNTVTTICATGDRFTNAMVFPRKNKTKLGDRFSATVGYRGGLSNRVAYVANSTEDLKESERVYLEEICKPYYAAVCTWYSTIGIDVKCGDMYAAIEEVIPKEDFGWHLNPGHYVATEEWMSSPIYKDSEIKIRDGSMLQMDIIISSRNTGGANAEDGVAVAGEKLRNEIEEKYPEVWTRIVKRRKYMQEVLGIPLKPEILPLSDIAGYYRPFLLCREKALTML